MRVAQSLRSQVRGAARLTLPLVVIGIEPGATTTRSATLRPCEFDTAEVTSRLTATSLSVASSWESPRFLNSMMARSFSVLSSGTAIAAQRLRVISWTVACAPRASSAGRGSVGAPALASASGRRASRRQVLVNRVAEVGVLHRVPRWPMAIWVHLLSVSA
jgi:hypothetical protein